MWILIAVYTALNLVVIILLKKLNWSRRLLKVNRELFVQIMRDYVGKVGFANVLLDDGVLYHFYIENGKIELKVTSDKEEIKKYLDMEE